MTPCPQQLQLHPLRGLHNRSRHNRRGGFIIIYTVIALTLLCGICSLAVDYARVQLAKAELRRAIDAAARAAASQIPNQLGNARGLAVEYAALNKVDTLPLNLKDSEIILGIWDTQTRHFTPVSDSQLQDPQTASQVNAVRIAARRTVGGADGPMPLTFASIIGIKSCDIRAEAICAQLDKPSGFGIVGLNGVSLSGGATIDSYRSDDGAYSAGSRRANGGVASNGSIKMSGNAAINGDAMLGPSGSVSGGSVAGTIKQLSAALTYPAPSAGDAAINNNNASVSQYVKNGSFSMSGQQVAHFPAGQYYFNSFTASGGSVIDANVDGPVTIYVTGDFTLSGGSSAYQGKAQNLKIVVLNPNTKVTLSGGTSMYVDVYAPLSTVTLSGNGRIYGQVLGQTVTMSGNGSIHYDESMAGTQHQITIVQ